MKSFIYLYPIPEIIDLEIEWGSHRKLFREVYREKLNECINERYRKNNFQINWAVFNHHEISDVIDLRKEDRILEVGMDFKTHCTKLPDKSYRYPDKDYILDKIVEHAVPEHLRIAGFHIFDCVEKLAGRACERGIDTLIDEDLTQFFRFRMFEKDFSVKHYKPRDISYMEGTLKQGYIDARKNKPYFLQDYLR